MPRLSGISPLTLMGSLTTNDRLCRNHHCYTTIAVQAVQEWRNSDLAIQVTNLISLDDLWNALTSWLTA